MLSFFIGTSACRQPKNQSKDGAKYMLNSVHKAASMPAHKKAC